MEETEEVVTKREWRRIWWSPWKVIWLLWAVSVSIWPRWSMWDLPKVLEWLN